jgi:hypothetical protein
VQAAARNQDSALLIMPSNRAYGIAFNETVRLNSIDLGMEASDK